MYSAYVLRSQKKDIFYIGHTQNIEKRLLEHNSRGNKKWAGRYQPWILVYIENFETRGQAMEREQYLKSLKRGNKWKELEQKFLLG
ncbi:GIY-YIG nuclease family protein [Candidatus Gracilibacteria bacterium]|nr:GIY-YIG nuclease family protein [Candidatus Gracilibacteria bacterium]